MTAMRRGYTPLSAALPAGGAFDGPLLTELIFTKSTQKENLFKVNPRR